jgi:hypothetical protein
MPKTEKKRFYIDFIKRLLEQFFNIFGFVKYTAYQFWQGYAMIMPATRKQRAAPLDYRQKVTTGEAPIRFVREAQKG